VFGRRRSASDRDLEGQAPDQAAPDQLVPDQLVPGQAAEAAGTAQGGAGPAGPWDVTEPHPELLRVDLGSLQVPVLDGTDIQLVFAEQHGAWVLVRHQLSEMQLQAFAAPKRSGLWEEVRGEIATEISAAGGRSEEREGPFGAEVVGQVPAEPGKPQLRPVRFVGVDGPRWFLRGMMLGAAAADPAAAAPLEAVYSQVVVVRGDHPMPPRDLLELRLPPEAAAAIEEQARAQQAAQQAGQEPNRFATTPNPFRRGPEMTETR
jgi:Protein of unknown function (DUF3710)